MRIRLARIITVILLLIVSGAAAVSCQEPNPDDTTNLKPGMGRISGVVTDDTEQLPEGTAVETYEGASIRVHQAVEAGRYRLAEGEPERIDYEAGELVTEVKSGEDGYWQVDLEPGRYFVRAFYGTDSYSGDILIEVGSGDVITLDLKLIHGV